MRLLTVQKQLGHSMILRNMSKSLKDKQAFFERLRACANCDEAEDALGPREQALRQQSRAFFPSAVQPSQALSSSQKRPASSLRRTASDPRSSPVHNGPVTIAATPNCGNARTFTSSVGLGNTVIPDTEKQVKKKRGRVPKSPLGDAPSPSVSVTKRKRSEPPHNKPDSQQLFKGLKFFYIPNDDINPARKSKIAKAQEYGATWMRNSAEATHIIVDKALSYADIKPLLDSSQVSSSVILVNENYPIDCILRGVIFDPKPTVEKHRYGIPGGPESTAEAIPPQPSIQDSNASLQIKSKRDTLPAEDDILESTQESNVSVPNSQPQGAESSEIATEPTGGAPLNTSPEPRNSSQPHAFTDELNACIDVVLEDPEKHKYLDESGSDKPVSENEASPEKKRKRASKSKTKTGKISSDEEKFVCMTGGTKGTTAGGPNADTIKLLEEMAEEYSFWNEVWRAQTYRKAITTLKVQPQKIKTAKEAAALPNIGSSLATHIEEITTTGRFRKLEELRAQPSSQALRLFGKMYGVGVMTAKKWVQQGYRTLDDIRANVKLTTNQKIGLEHYDDLLTRIPRAEVEALGECVREAGAAIDPAVEFIIAGSYRRGGESSSDVDLLVTKPGTSSVQELTPFLDQLTEALTAQGFLTAVLASHRAEDGNKWQGCCVLPESRFPGPEKKAYRPTWRRIDFLIVPHSEIGAALIYFTGNDMFNRSMRLLAQTKNMKLNHKELAGAGVREGKDERKIFELLGVQWREPHERWC